MLSPARASTTAEDQVVAYVANTGANQVLRIDADGTQTTVGSGFAQPTGVVLTRGGDLLVDDYGHNRIVAVAPDGTQTTLVDDLNLPFGIAEGPEGSVLVANYDTDEVLDVDQQGDRSTVGSGLSSPTGVAVDHDGDVFIADYGNDRVVRVTPGGTQSVVGSDFSAPTGVAVDRAGDVFVADFGHNQVVEVAPDGTQTVLGSGFYRPAGVAVNRAGQVFVADYRGSRLVRIDPDGTQAVMGTGVRSPFAVAVPDAVRVAMPQSIAFTSEPPSDTEPGSTYEPTARGGGSGRPVLIQVDPASTDVCSPDGNTIHLDHAGTCTLDALQDGDDDYAAAARVQQVVTVRPITQAVTITSPPADPSRTVVGATLALSAHGGSSGLPVAFSVDTRSMPDACTVLDHGNGTADVRLEHAGSCVVDADQAGDSDHAPAPTTIVTTAVSTASTETDVTVRPDTLRARVGAVPPGAGTPGGDVTFSVDGQPVGTATLVSGVATLSTAVPPGMTRRVAATYLGDPDFTGSSGATVRQSPLITSTVTSVAPLSRFGWYHSAVQVTFDCRPQGSPLLTPCPGPVTLAHDGAGQSLTRTITAVDGGVATAVVSGIDIDTTRPRVMTSSVRDGDVFTGAPPAATCRGADALSGAASCRVRVHRSGHLAHYRVTVTDRAGNSTVRRGRFRVLTRFLLGASYVDGAFTVHPWHSYPLVVTDARRRPHLDGAAAHRRSAGVTAQPFHATGRHRWEALVTVTGAMAAHRHWELGLRTGRRTSYVPLRVTRGG